jgi:predicted nucleic acid-binding protein
VLARLFVDSGAWLAFFSARDGLHSEADRLIKEAFRQKVPLFTSNLVVAEVQRLLLHRAGIKPALAAIDAIDQSRGVTVKFADAATHKDARAWLLKLSDQVISYTDACSFALMKAHRCTAALSFDQDFVVAGFARWKG